MSLKISGDVSLVSGDVTSENLTFGRLDRKKTRGRFGETSFLLRRTYLCACPSISKPFAGLMLGFDLKKKKNYERLLAT